MKEPKLKSELEKIYNFFFNKNAYEKQKHNDSRKKAIIYGGSCNVKIIMNLKDPTETYELFVKAVNGQLKVKK